MNIRNDIYNTIREGLPITLPASSQQDRGGLPYVLVTDGAPEEVREMAGESRRAFIVSQEPLQISFPDSDIVVDVKGSDIVMEAVKKGGRPHGGPHIQNVRFWDLPEDQLKYVIKDASAAINANPAAQKASGKWADEINDAATVLYWRKKKNIKVESVETETVVQTKTVSGRKIQIKKVGAGPAHKIYVEDDPAQEFPSAAAAKSWLKDYEAAGGHFTYESVEGLRGYVRNYMSFISGGSALSETKSVGKRGSRVKKSS